MANIQHSALTGSDLHEPKGVATATSGQVYVANGAGSGNWTSAFQYGDIETVESDAVTVSTIGTTPQTFPFASNGVGSGITVDAANNRLTLPTAGTYFVIFTVSFSTNNSADAGLYEFKIMDDGTETGFAVARQMSGTSDTGSASVASLLTVGAGSHITIQVESDNVSDSDGIDIYTANLLAFKVG